MCSEVAPSLLCCKEVASRPVRVLNSSDFFDSSCACVCALVCLASATWSSCTAVVPVFVLVAVGQVVIHEWPEADAARCSDALPVIQDLARAAIFVRHLAIDESNQALGHPRL